MNANIFLVLISGDILGDVDMCLVFGLISSHPVFLPSSREQLEVVWFAMAGKQSCFRSTRCRASCAAVCQTQRQNSWRRRQSRRYIGDLDTMFVRRVYAAYRHHGAIIWESFLINNPDKLAHYYQLIQRKRTCHIICRSTDDLRPGLKLSVQEAD